MAREERLHFRRDFFRQEVVDDAGDQRDVEPGFDERGVVGVFVGEAGDQVGGVDGGVEAGEDGVVHGVDGRGVVDVALDDEAGVAGEAGVDDDGGRSYDLVGEAAVGVLTQNFVDDVLSLEDGCHELFEDGLVVWVGADLAWDETAGRGVQGRVYLFVDVRYHDAIERYDLFASVSTFLHSHPVFGM